MVCKHEREMVFHRDVLCEKVSYQGNSSLVNLHYLMGALVLFLWGFIVLPLGGKAHLSGNVINILNNGHNDIIYALCLCATVGCIISFNAVG